MRLDPLRFARQSPAAFREALIIDTDAGPRKCAPLLDDWQRADFNAIDSAWQKLAGHSANPRYQRAWIERPRGHSKTSDIAAMVSYALFASSRRVAGVCAAADKDQAGLIRDAVEKLCQLNHRWLGSELDVQANVIKNKKTGAECEILSSDVASSYGLTPDFVICDEITHWAKRDLWDSLFSAAAKRAHCLLVVICNAGWKADWQWPLREAVRVDSRWYFSHLDGPRASWITPDRLDEQRKLLPPAVYRRLWLNEWVDGSGDAITESDLTAACTLTGPMLSPEPGWAFVAGVDLGLKRDCSAVAVVAKHCGYFSQREEAKTSPTSPPGPLSALEELGYFDPPEKTVCSNSQPEYIPGTGCIRLVDIAIHAPVNGQTVELEQVERELLALHQKFNLSVISADPWQAAYLIERLNKANIPTSPCDFTSSNLRGMASEVLSAFSEKRISLFPHSALLADLRAMRVVEKSYGIRLEMARNSTGGTRHGDASTALSIALLAAKNITGHSRQATVNRPLLCWP